MGQGGFASVYLAHDPTLNRNVAIKVLKPTAFFSSDASTRFDREAQAAAILNHPNIIPVFETATMGNDRYIVSAFSDGITLKQWSEGKADKLDPRVVAQIVVTLADAVEHAHQRGIVHRDLKPANILIETSEDSTPLGPGRTQDTLLLACTEMHLDMLDECKTRFETALAHFEVILEGLPANHKKDLPLINVARCHLQLARVARGQLSMDEYDASQKVELLAEARDGFDRAAFGFQSLLDINPLINSGWGQLAMVYELRVRLETEQKYLTGSSLIAGKFDKMFRKTPERVREYRIIGRILAESRLKVAKVMIELDQIEDATKQLHLTKSLLVELIEKYPGVAKLDAAMATCKELLAEHAN